MIGHGQGRSGAIYIFPKHCNVCGFTHDPESQKFKSANHPSLGGVNGKLRHLYRHCFINQKSFQNREIFIPCFCAKCLDMKLHSRFYVRQCCFIRLSLSNDDALQSEGIAHITIGISFNNNLKTPQNILLVSCLFGRARGHRPYVSILPSFIFKTLLLSNSLRAPLAIG